MSSGLFKGKRVFITGSTGGIGRALVEAFHKEGAEICLSGRDKEKLDQLASDYGSRCSSWPLDLSTSEYISSTIKSVTLEKGPIDILINNGGITKDSLSVRMNNAHWDEVIQVNLTSCFQLAREVSRSMIQRKTGRIINISSVVGLMGNPGQANYAASKAGMIGFTKTMALELASRGITVNAIAPGYIRTAMTDKMPEHFVSAIASGTYGEPKDVAFAALFLADDRAQYITGETLNVNGGLACF